MNERRCLGVKSSLTLDPERCLGTIGTGFLPYSVPKGDSNVLSSKIRNYAGFGAVDYFAEYPYNFLNMKRSRLAGSPSHFNEICWCDGTRVYGQAAVGPMPLEPHKLGCKRFFCFSH